ncbi:MAG: beta-ketoacyl-[acyl-carrier-protein] synthase family protein, partial [Myxococcales bacterium]|nr:beta-ketoacyl-[acyl-carrier-protein] synthase family protein [Myxococcales bacterium]
HTFSIACASSTVALGEAFRAIRDGYADRLLGAGAEAMLNDGTIAGWKRLGVLASPHASGPEASSRPFDRERSGFVLGEGAVVFVLESENAMEERGGEPLAEIVGFGASSDAHSITDPYVDGLESAMRRALADAELEPSAVGYVNAHATATAKGDPVELEAIARIFGPGAPGLAVSSTKGVHGHLVGAAGALEALLTVGALRGRRVPPNTFLDDPDPDLGIDLVPKVGRDADDLEFAMSNSFAFGGSNAVLVLRRV